MCIRDSFLRRAEIFNKMFDHIDRAKWECEIDLLFGHLQIGHAVSCLLYTSDAADERSSVDLGGRRIIKKKK